MDYPCSHNHAKYMKIYSYCRCLCTYSLHGWVTLNKHLPAFENRWSLSLYSKHILMKCKHNALWNNKLFITHNITITVTHLFFFMFFNLSYQPLTLMQFHCFLLFSFYRNITVLIFLVLFLCEIKTLYPLN